MQTGGKHSAQSSAAIAAEQNAQRLNANPVVTCTTRTKEAAPGNSEKRIPLLRTLDLPLDVVSMIVGMRADRDPLSTTVAGLVNYSRVNRRWHEACRDFLERTGPAEQITRQAGNFRRLRRNQAFHLFEPLRNEVDHLLESKTTRLLDATKTMCFKPRWSDIVDLRKNDTVLVLNLSTIPGREWKQALQAMATLEKLQRIVVKIRKLEPEQVAHYLLPALATLEDRLQLNRADGNSISLCLVCRDTKWSREEVNALISFLNRNAGLVELDLHGANLPVDSQDSHFSEGDESLDCMVRPIVPDWAKVQSTGIRKLNLSCCNLYGLTAPLVDMLLHSSELVELDLSYNFLGYPSVEELRQLVCIESSTIRRIKLDGNCFNDGDLVELVGLFQDQSEKLDHISLENNYFSAEAVAEVRKKIAAHDPRGGALFIKLDRQQGEGLQTV